MSGVPGARRALGALSGGLDRLRPAPRGVAVLAYHRVGAATPVSVDLPVGQVAEQLDWLCASSRLLTLDDAATRLVDPSGDPPGRPEVVLTADDGTADWTEVLLALLVDRQLAMTWYVATRFVDEGLEFPNGGRPVSWSALRDAVSTGLVTVGSHTHSHAVMARLDAAGAAQELDRSASLIEDRLGQPCHHFAYPKAIAPSEMADREVRRRFRTAALAGTRINVAGRTDLGRLGRSPIQRRDSIERFAAKVAGAGRTEGWVRERYDRRRHHDALG